MPRIRCVRPPEKAIHFSWHREPFVAGVKQCYLCWKHIFTIPFLPCFHKHTEKIPYIFMLALLFMDSICSDFPSRSRLYPVVKLHTFFFALNILLRALKIHFFSSDSNGQWILHETEKPLRNYAFRSASEPPTSSSATWEKAREKRGEKEKNRLREEIKLFLNKNGKFTSFLTSQLTRYSRHVKLISCLQLPLCFCLRFS